MTPEPRYGAYDGSYWPHLTEPVLPTASDGIYPRCVWCRGENYALAVIAYSAGEIACAAVRSCGRKLPEDYIVEVPDDA